VTGTDDGGQEMNRKKAVSIYMLCQNSSERRPLTLTLLASKKIGGLLSVLADGGWDLIRRLKG
jgi:hypothetical protein